MKLEQNSIYFKQYFQIYNVVCTMYFTNIGICSFICTVVILVLDIFPMEKLMSSLWFSITIDKACNFFPSCSLKFPDLHLFYIFAIQKYYKTLCSFSKRNRGRNRCNKINQQQYVHHYFLFNIRFIIVCSFRTL